MATEIPSRRTRFKMIRDAVYILTGGGYGREKNLLANFVVRQNELRASLPSIAASSPYQMGSTPHDGSVDHRRNTGALDKVRQVTGAFVSREIENVDAILSIPTIAGLRRDQTRITLDGLVRSYGQELKALWSDFVEAATFCIDYPLLPDPENLDKLRRFSQAAIAYNLPGSEMVDSLSTALTRSIVEQTPSKDAVLPKNFLSTNFEVPLAEALSKPDVAARKIFAAVRHTEFLSKLQDHHFGTIAESARDAFPYEPRPAFSEQLRTLAQKAVIQAMKGVPSDQRSKLMPYAKAMHDCAEKISAQHDADREDVLSLNRKSRASVTAAVNAMRNIRERCPNEFAQLAPDFVDQYVSHMKSSQRAQVVRPIEIPTMAQIKERMPDFSEVEIDVSLADYAKTLEALLKKSDQLILRVPLATGGWRQSYLDPLGSDNSYARMGEEMREALERDFYAFNEANFREGKREDLSRRIQHRACVGLINQRLGQFERLRGRLFEDIRAMLDNPMFITQKRFGTTVAMMEQVRVASEEMHLHFAKAFVHAWEGIPALVLEKSIKAWDKVYVRMTSKEAEKEWEHSRGPSRGM